MPPTPQILRPSPSRILFISPPSSTSAIQYCVYERSHQRSLAADLRYAAARVPFLKAELPTTILTPTPALITSLQTIEQNDDDSALSIAYNYSFPTKAARNKVLFDPIPSQDVATIFAVTRDAYHEAGEALQDFKFINSQTIIIPQLASLAPGHALYLICEPKDSLHLYLYTNHHLQAAQSYSIHTADDALYYALSLATLLAIAPQNLSCTIIPTQCEPQGLAELLASTFLQAQTLTLPRQYLRLQKEGFPIDLIMLLLPHSLASPTMMSGARKEEGE